MRSSQAEHYTYFPVVLTRKYTCDRAVVTLLWARTLGNSPTALRHNLQEVHSEEWLRRQLRYLADCESHRKGLQQFGQPTPEHQTEVASRILACGIVHDYVKLTPPSNLNRGVISIPIKQHSKTTSHPVVHPIANHISSLPYSQVVSGEVEPTPALV